MHGRNVETMPFTLAREIEGHQVRYHRRYLPPRGLHGVDVGLVEPGAPRDVESDHANRYAAVEHGPGRLRIAIDVELGSSSNVACSSRPPHNRDLTQPTGEPRLAREGHRHVGFRAYARQYELAAILARHVY